MLIGLIADTHIPRHAKELPPQVKEIFRGVDLILHAGDVYDVSVLDELECIAPVLVAEGDDDGVIVTDRRVKTDHVFNVEGVSIWLTHIRLFRPNGCEKFPDVIVSGHTHVPELERSDGTLRINPGSPTYPGYEARLGTVGLLTVQSGRAEAEIIQLE